jgi:hypothetical protein
MLSTFPTEALLHHSALQDVVISLAEALLHHSALQDVVISLAEALLHHSARCCKLSLAVAL